LSRHQIMQWLHHLRTFRHDETTNLGARVAELVPSLKNRALVIVLSDMHDAKAIPALKRLGQQHDCVVVQLRDPAEQNLRGVGFLRAREAETGRSFVTHGRSQWLDHDSVATEMRRAGIDHMLMETDKPYSHKLRRFFESRNLLGRGAR